VLKGGLSAYNSGVGFWANPRVLGAEGIDDSPQAQVYTTSHKSRSNSETHNLDQETVLAPLVLVGLDSTNVANDLENDTGKHGEMEGKGSTCHSIGCEKSDEGDGEEGEESCVGRQRNAVVIIGRTDRTCIEGAVCELVCMGPVGACSEHHDGLNV
jgi:hypothetical protein